jgi:hypothetical protein
MLCEVLPRAPSKAISRAREALSGERKTLDWEWAANMERKSENPNWLLAPARALGESAAGRDCPWACPIARLESGKIAARRKSSRRLICSLSTDLHSIQRDSGGFRDRRPAFIER